VEQGAIPWRRLSLFARRNPQKRIPPLGSPPCGRRTSLKASASPPQHLVGDRDTCKLQEGAPLRGRNSPRCDPCGTP
jgi:hypothetical protein